MIPRKPRAVVFHLINHSQPHLLPTPVFGEVSPLKSANSDSAVRRVQPDEKCMLQNLAKRPKIRNPNKSSRDTLQK